jgi:DNA-directed RNA polymerase subunit M/transcription elongation factor TFIIS
MAEKEPDKATCPRCSAHNARVVGRKANLRPRPQTGDLRADLTPVSTTVTYECHDCGHGWDETVPS